MFFISNVFSKIRISYRYLSNSICALKHKFFVNSVIGCKGLVSIFYKHFKFYSIRGSLGGIVSKMSHSDHQKHASLSQQFSNFTPQAESSLNANSWGLCASKSFRAKHTVACNTFYKKKIPIDHHDSSSIGASSSS